MSPRESRTPRSPHLAGSQPESSASPFRAFLRPTVWTLAASIGLVAVTGWLTARYVRGREASPAPDRAAFQQLGATPLDASSPAVPVRAPAPPPLPRRADPAPFAAAGLSPEAQAALAIVDEIERKHGEGAYAVARKRFDPCPGEDVERLAWIDTWSRIAKVTGREGEGESAITREQWFDEKSRLRGARLTRAGASPFALRALFDEDGRAAHVERTGSAPAPEAARLSLRDPSAAFFTKPRCAAP